MDDVAKRREARRRKILENSQNRLNRITGIEQKSSLSDISTKSEVRNYVAESPVCENHTDFNTEEFPSNSNAVNEVQPQQDKVKEVKQPPKQYRTTVISALAVFINLLIVAAEKLEFDANSSNINKIFLPLLVYEIIEFLSLHKYKTEHKSFIYLLLATNGQNKFLLVVIKYLELFSGVLQDVMVYFFVFVWCDFVKFMVSS